MSDFFDTDTGFVHAKTKADHIIQRDKWDVVYYLLVLVLVAGCIGYVWTFHAWTRISGLQDDNVASSGMGHG